MRKNLKGLTLPADQDMPSSAGREEEGEKGGGVGVAADSKPSGAEKEGGEATTKRKAKAATAAAKKGIIRRMQSEVGSPPQAASVHLINMWTDCFDILPTICAT